ncbi:MAG: phosphonoacetaldehyde hydrolase [Fusobacteriaceae bacterium]
MVKTKISGVILDWSGTTVDYGGGSHPEAFIQIFKEAGIRINLEEAKKPMGLSKRDHTREILKSREVKAQWDKVYSRDFTEEDVKKMYKRFKEIIFENLENYATVAPGVLKLQEKLRKKGIKIGSTTGYPKKMLDIISKNAKNQGYEPDFKVTPTEVPAGRPYPYMIFRNMIALEIPDRKSIIKVGDTVADILEGKEAGVWTVGILKGGSELGLSKKEITELNSEELSYAMKKTAKKMYDAGADYVIEDIEELERVINIIEIKN